MFHPSAARLDRSGQSRRTHPRWTVSLPAWVGISLPPRQMVGTGVRFSDGRLRNEDRRALSAEVCSRGCRRRGDQASGGGYDHRSAYDRAGCPERAGGFCERGSRGQHVVDDHHRAPGQLRAGH